MQMTTIGRKDKLDLPEFNLVNIDAKVDTGAYGCALHCHHVELKMVNGKEMLCFQLLDPSHPEYENKTYKTSKFSDKLVKNSGGIAEHRYTISTEMVLFNETHLVDFSLTDRQKMKHPILIGRKFLNKRFIVDVSRKNISYELK
jgi:hypothetical protein